MMQLLEELPSNDLAALAPNATKSEFRNYEDSARQSTVSDFYYENHKNQTLSFVLAQKEKYSKMNGPQMSIWNAIVLLNELVDNRYRSFSPSFHSFFPCPTTEPLFSLINILLPLLLSIVIPILLFPKLCTYYKLLR